MWRNMTTLVVLVRFLKGTSTLNSAQFAEQSSARAKKKNWWKTSLPKYSGCWFFTLRCVDWMHRKLKRGFLATDVRILIGDKRRSTLRRRWRIDELNLGQSEFGHGAFYFRNSFRLLKLLYQHQHFDDRECQLANYAINWSMFGLFIWIFGKNEPGKIWF